VNSCTIRNCLRRFFSQQGIPKLLISDNASYFISGDLQAWFAAIGTEHQTIAPYHPQSNGLAERFVDTVKQHVKAINCSDLQTAIDRFLMQYRNSIHLTTLKTPAEMIYGESNRTPLHALVGKRVYFKRAQASYRPAIIESRIGNAMLTVRDEEGTTHKVHQDQSKGPFPDYVETEDPNTQLRRSSRTRFPVQRYGMS